MSACVEMECRVGCDPAIELCTHEGAAHSGTRTECLSRTVCFGDPIRDRLAGSTGILNQ